MSRQTGLSRYDNPRPRSQGHRFRADTIAAGFFLVSAVGGVLLTCCIFGYMLFFGFPLLREGRFLDLIARPWSPGNGLYGVYPMIVGTVAIAAVAVLISLPLSLGSAALISVIAPKGVGAGFRKIVQMMTGIPTVIYGFVGIFLLVPMMRSLFGGGSGLCVLSASLMLALLVSPTMILFFTDSFERVPSAHKFAVDALGATCVQKLFYLILPASRKGLLAGLVLALGRALGDTLIALMLAGNAITVPHGLSDPARSLTAHIALVIAADFESLEFKSIFVCGIVLYAFTTGIVLVVRSLEKRWKTN